MLAEKWQEPRMVFTCFECNGRGPCHLCHGSGRLWESDDEYEDRLKRIAQIEAEK